MIGVGGQIKQKHPLTVVTVGSLHSSSTATCPSECSEVPRDFWSRQLSSRCDPLLRSRSGITEVWRVARLLAASHLIVCSCKKLWREDEDRRSRGWENEIKSPRLPQGACKDRVLCLRRVSRSCRRERRQSGIPVLSDSIGAEVGKGYFWRVIGVRRRSSILEHTRTCSC